MRDSRFRTGSAPIPAELGRAFEQLGTGGIESLIAARFPLMEPALANARLEVEASRLLERGLRTAFEHPVRW